MSSTPVTPDTAAPVTAPSTAVEPVQLTVATETPDQIAAEAAPFEQRAEQATTEAANLAAKPLLQVGPVPGQYTGPHARLLNMIQGLALGMDAFGKSLATGGREGGVQEVEQANAQKQAMQQRAQQAAQQQRDFETQQKILTAATNEKTANDILLMHSIPLDLEAKDLTLEKTQQELSQSEAQFRLSNPFGWNAQQLNGFLSGQSTPQMKSIFNSRMQQTVDAAIQNPELGPNNKYVQNLQAALQSPSPNPTKVWNAYRQLQSETKLQSGVTQARKEMADTASSETVASEKANAWGSYTAHHVAGEDFTTWQARQTEQMKQSIDEGDPTAIGESLAQGLVAPSQISSRAMSKPFYSKVLAAADAYSIRTTGQHFNLAKAEAQYNYAKNPQVQNTLNMIDTLNEPGGDFDILKDATSALPKMNQATLNKIFNATATEFGSPEATRYHTALYNLATLEAQVQKGGVPDQTQIQDVLNQFKASFSKGQISASIEVARQDIAARKRAIVRNNPTLLAMYPEQQPRQSGTVTVTDPNGGVHVFPDQASANRFKQLAGIR